MKKTAQRRKKGNLIFPLLILICLSVMGFSLFKIVTISLEYRQGEKEYDILQSYTTEKESSKVGDKESTEPSVETDKAEQSRTSEQEKSLNAEGNTSDTECPIAVDFANLKEINPDLVCWLYIPVLEISYPVVQGTDNDFYLHRTFEGTENFAGSVFVDAEIEHPLKDPHTIIYGHSMKNQTMFGKLKFLLQDDLYSKDPVFWIITEEGDTRYQMADICYTEAGSSVYTIFDTSGEEYADYLRDICENSRIRNDQLPEITPDTKLVTLSTCAASEGTARLVVRGMAEQ